jgi:hypothetical protein
MWQTGSTAAMAGDEPTGKLILEVEPGFGCS